MASPGTRPPLAARAACSLLARSFLLLHATCLARSSRVRSDAFALPRRAAAATGRAAAARRIAASATAHAGDDGEARTGWLHNTEPKQYHAPPESGSS